SRWFLNVSSTSSKPPDEIMSEVMRALRDSGARFQLESGYTVTCEVDIEVCKVPRMNLFGLHFKRLSGGVWNYKKFCNRLLGSMNI
ncbi:KA1 domain/Ssp2 C-terminal domain-containing protein, partial [Blyttiomyces helicus]